MILTGRSGSRALDGALAGIGTALSARDDRDPETLWVLGTPGAGDWPRVAAWEGRVAALLVPHGLYLRPLTERITYGACFDADADLLGSLVEGRVGVPALRDGVPTSPPPLGSPLGDVWIRRLHGSRRLPESAGVSWVASGGSAAVAEATGAWARRQAVILLSSTPAPPPLDQGAVIIARSALEADEATSFLDESRAIARALAHEGARTAMAMPDAPAAAESLVVGARQRSL